MGLLDNVCESLNRGANALGRSGNSAQLNMQHNDLMRLRQKLAVQLGASLYDQTKDDSTFTEGREPIYDGIAAIDAQRTSIEA